LQDDIVRSLVPPHLKPRKEPILLFTAGAMGVGKTFVIRWMAEHGVLPLSEFALIDPDKMARLLPEHKGYLKHDPSLASMMTRLEAGLLTELGLIHALQQQSNILVDSSLRHGAWYSRVLQRVRTETPNVKIVLLYVHSTEEVIHRRAKERGKLGRVAPTAEVQDSLEKMARAVSRLLPHVDVFAQVANYDGNPIVTAIGDGLVRGNPSWKSVDFDYEDEEEFRQMLEPTTHCTKAIGWNDLASTFALAKDGPVGTPLDHPPKVLPYYDTKESQPLMQLLKTIVFAADKHQGQTRKDERRTPYINHPIAVAKILAEVGIRDLETLQVALLHDTLEDTDTTLIELRTNFGTEVASLVESLTDDDSLRPSMRKLRQLRGAKSLSYKAKLVRIADKMHNVSDIINNGIPGWSKARTDAYVTWACELVTALRGTHQELEQRFFSDLSLPLDYTVGDWEKSAAEEADEFAWGKISSVPTELQVSDINQDTTLAEHKAVYSLLSAAEFLAQHQKFKQRDERTNAFWRALNVALVLAQHGVRDSETLQAALVRGNLDSSSVDMDDTESFCDSEYDSTGTLLGTEISLLKHKVRERLGVEVAYLIAALNRDSAGTDEQLMKLPAKAKQILMAEVLWDLCQIQISGISCERTFRQLAKQARKYRRLFKGINEPLEAGLDNIFSGQVRLSNGQLVQVAEAIRRRNKPKPDDDSS